MIESDAHVDIFRRCGGLIIDTSTASLLHGVRGFARVSADLAQEHGIAHEILSGKEARGRFPGFALQDDAFVYFEPGAGYIRPEVAIEAQLRLARQSGAAIQTETEVRGFTRIAGGGVRIATARGIVEVDQCLLAAGAWVVKFLPLKAQARFAITRQVLHWVPIRTGSYQHGASPIFIWDYGDGKNGHVYGFPSLDEATIKVATEQFEESPTPEAIARVVSAEEQMQFFREHLLGKFSEVLGPPLRSKVCLYTVAPEARFVVDYHPEIAELLVASCCSGHGFKHSVAIGEALGAMLRGGRSGIDLRCFRSPEWRMP